MRSLALFCTLALAAAACAAAGVDDNPASRLDSRADHGQPEPLMAGIHWARGGSHGPPGGGGSSPNLVYHGGVVQHGTEVHAIFWGTGWASSGADKIAAMDSFYSGVGGSSYAQTNTEYTDSDGNVSDSVTYTGHTVDTSATPHHVGAKTSDILNEVCAAMGNNVVAGAYYPVYVDAARNHAGYCAWHSAGTCNGKTIQFGFFFGNLDGDTGCDPKDTTTGHSEGIAALGNVTGHELSEMLTDPQLDAWYDSGGAENADKCAWRFGSDSVKIGHDNWKIQGNWSNYAYDHGTGYANSNGDPGCLDGGNY